MGQPVQFPCIIRGVGRCHRRAAERAVPRDFAAAGGGGEPQGNVGPPGPDCHAAAVCMPIHRDGVGCRVRRQIRRSTAGHGLPFRRIPVKLPATESVQQRPQGNISHAALQIIHRFQHRAVHLHRHRLNRRGRNGGASRQRCGQQPCHDFPFHHPDRPFCTGPQAVKQASGRRVFRFCGNFYKK
ncbi:hypothetical protein SDC9_163084 [bioreactor metagenome]|uniref:Uncharacterized protein n=1 Tax=bioreactor metagenome TaxID=1076179 RepID=A0A645FQT4_9ZZZZ